DGRWTDSGPGSPCNESSSRSACSSHTPAMRDCVTTRQKVRRAESFAIPSITLLADHLGAEKTKNASLR
ncbi:unnamed protein product, partial [Choristocarpus tenellus]